MSTRGLPERFAGLVAALALVAPALHAQSAPDQSAARARIESERGEAEARFGQALLACAGSFALTACQDSARAERRHTIERLNAERAMLDEQLRRERAQARRQDIDQHLAERAATAASTASAPERSPRKATLPASRPPAPAVAPAAAAAAAREAEALARWRERQQRYEAHLAEVRRRNAELEARKPAAAALPVPAASGGR